LATGFTVENADAIEVDVTMIGTEDSCGIHDDIPRVVAVPLTGYSDRLAEL
jgi:hypothetical protein